jgi:hypothetical protein
MMMEADSPQNTGNSFHSDMVDCQERLTGLGLPQNSLKSYVSKQWLYKKD